MDTGFRVESSSDPRDFERLEMNHGKMAACSSDAGKPKGKKLNFYPLPTANVCQEDYLYPRLLWLMGFGIS